MINCPQCGLHHESVECPPHQLCPPFFNILLNEIKLQEKYNKAIERIGELEELIFKLNDEIELLKEGICFCYKIPKK